MAESDLVMEISETIQSGEKTTIEDTDMKIESAIHNPNASEKNQSNADEEKLQANEDQSPMNISSLNGDSKREREDGDEDEGEDGVSKKQKIDKSDEDEILENSEQLEEKQGIKDGEEENKSDPVSLGPKDFTSSVQMFDYFYKFLHFWRPNLNVNTYEYKVLLDLLKKGHVEPEKKIGEGVRAFQVRYHPMWKSRCFFIIRNDESVDDFSFRKCVNQILPLPENMKVKSDVNEALAHHRGGGGRGGRRGGHGRGRGRRS